MLRCQRIPNQINNSSKSLSQSLTTTTSLALTKSTPLLLPLEVKDKALRVARESKEARAVKIRSWSLTVTLFHRLLLVQLLPSALQMQATLSRLSL